MHRSEEALWLGMSVGVSLRRHGKVCNCMMLVTTEAAVKCKITYISLPIVEVRQIRELSAKLNAPGRGRSSSSKGRDGKGRGRGQQARRVFGRGLRVAALKKKGELTKAIVYRQWPVMLPDVGKAISYMSEQSLYNWLVCDGVLCAGTTRHWRWTRPAPSRWLFTETRAEAKGSAP